MTDTDAIRTLVEAIRPILAGHPAPVQSAALADCLATWLAGHEIPGKMHLTHKMRAALLAELVFEVVFLRDERRRIIAEAVEICRKNARAAIDAWLDAAEMAGIVPL